MKQYLVKSIFGPTVAGEGSTAGTPVKFLRLAGCNRWSGLPQDKPSATCHFCDTDFRGGDRLTAEEIVKRLMDLGPVDTVVISGGEPTLQIDDDLLRTLSGSGYFLHLETNGSKALGQLETFFDHITMSPKQARKDTKLEWCDDLKVLYPPIGVDITPESFESFPGRGYANASKEKFLQPVYNGYNKDDVNLKATLEALYELKDWRLSLQTHKIIGVE